jgi:hypothetical protein
MSIAQNDSAALSLRGHFTQLSSLALASVRSEVALRFLIAPPLPHKNDHKNLASAPAGRHCLLRGSLPPAHLSIGVYDLSTLTHCC